MAARHPEAPRNDKKYPTQVLPVFKLTVACDMSRANVYAKLVEKAHLKVDQKMEKDDAEGDVEIDKVGNADDEGVNLCVNRGEVSAELEGAKVAWNLGEKRFKVGDHVPEYLKGTQGKPNPKEVGVHKSHREKSFGFSICHVQWQ